MPPLPRFHAGHIGPATFADWNRVMQGIERVENTPVVPKSQNGGGRRFFAQLIHSGSGPTWQAGYEYFEWIQVEARHTEPSAPWSWVPTASGLSSSSFLNGPAYAVSIGGAVVGDIVELARVTVTHGDDLPNGRPWFVVIPLAKDVGVASGRILAKIPPIGSLGLPGYTVTTYSGSSTFDEPSGPVVKAINAFEVASAVQSQVSTQSPGTKTLLDLPTNTPVGPMHKLPIPTGLPNSEAVYLFTFPNAYQVVC